MSSLVKIDDNLDKEWEELIFYARSLGLTIEEIRHFLEASKLDKTSIC